MKKLIEVEVDEFKEGNICYCCGREGCEGYPHDDNRCFAKRWMDEQPTVDAVPVVRCKDCNFYYRARVWCKLNNTTMCDEDFCSYGELKEGEYDEH